MDVGEYQRLLSSMSTGVLKRTQADTEERIRKLDRYAKLRPDDRPVATQLEHLRSVAQLLEAEIAQPYR